MGAKFKLGKSLCGIVFAGLAVASCTTTQNTTPAEKTVTPAAKPVKNPKTGKVTYNYNAKDRDCLKRAMYFESRHSDHDGYMAVGTVVMNRLTSGAYPETICGVVAQEKQFAPGVMTREVKGQAEPDLELAADALFRGERNPKVREAMFFHTAGMSFPYRNMHYTTVAGGNSFYEKRAEDGSLETPAPLPSYEVAMNYVPMQYGAFTPSYVASQSYKPAQSYPAGQIFTQEEPAAAAVASSAPAAPSVQVAYVSNDARPSLPGVGVSASPSAEAPQFATILPATVPVPTPAPQAATAVQPKAAPMTSTFDTTPTSSVVVPMPRPSSLDNASLRGSQPRVRG